MPMPSDSNYPPLAPQAFVLKEQGIEDAFIEKLRSLLFPQNAAVFDDAPTRRF
jgi:hypothetical protein